MRPTSSAPSPINLQPGSFSSIAGTNNIAIAFGAFIEAAIGSNYNDVLKAGDAGSTLHGALGNDTLIGGAAADVLVGGAGNDVLIGGSGADRFVMDVLPSGGYAVDLISDYDHGAQLAIDLTEGDWLDLSSLLGAPMRAAIGGSVSDFVRAVADSSGHTALLQIDLDGSVGGASWITIARLSGIKAGTVLDILLDAMPPASTASFQMHDSGADSSVETVSVVVTAGPTSELLPAQRLQRGRQGRHPVAEYRRHAGGLAARRQRRGRH